MKKRYCPECGGEIMITRRLPDRSWIIGEQEFVRADNNITDDDELIFHCVNDMEHDIDEHSDQFENWSAEIMIQYERKIMPFL